MASRALPPLEGKRNVTFVDEQNYVALREARNDVIGHIRHGASLVAESFSINQDKARRQMPTTPIRSREVLPVLADW